MVEDDPVIATMYRIRLELEGWLVEVCPNGLAGLESALADPPAVVVLDMIMPVMDGLGFLEGLRAGEGTRVLPVLVLSNSPGLDGHRRRVEALGTSAWLTKSQTSPADLVEILRPYLVS